MTNIDVAQRRLKEIEDQIKEVEGVLSNPLDDGAWCLGDPYELLFYLERERARLRSELEDA